MARTFTEKERSEILAAEAGLRTSGFDVDHSFATHNANLIMDYFEKNPSVPVTVQSIYAFVESQKTSFVWRTAAQQRFDKIAAEDPAKAQQLADLIKRQGGKPGALVHEGDQFFDNMASLLAVLRGYDLSAKNIQDAKDRIFHAGSGRKLHYVPEARRPLSEAAKADDPNRKPGQLFSAERANEPQWVRLSRERSERDAMEAAANQRSSASAQSAAVREAKQKAESLRGATHSEDAQIAAIFVTTPGTSEINWSQTLQARLRMQQSLNKAREVRRFIR